MDFKSFVGSLLEGQVISRAGQDFTVLGFSPEQVLLRPHGSPVTASGGWASVRVLCITPNNFSIFYNSHESIQTAR